MSRLIKKYWPALLCVVALFTFYACSSNPSGGDVVNDDDDNIPPGTITDLRANNVSTTSLTLLWTAPGEDNDTGVAYEYDMRGSLDSITDQNFVSAVQIDDAPAPLPAGFAQSYAIDSLESGQTYYFAIKTSDMAGNWSAISNCLGVTCSTDVVINFPDTVLERLMRETIGKPTGDIYRSDVDTIEGLVFTDEGITDLTGLESFTNLFWLDLFNNDISDLTPIGGLTNLGGLHIGGNNISDLTPIAGLVNLMQFTAGNTPIDDITPLENMNKIIVVRLNDTDVSDFSALYAKPWLEEINLGNNLLGDIDFIANFHHLRFLELYGNNITDISALDSLTTLESLVLRWNRISDLSPLSPLVNLTYIDLNHNLISNLLPLVNNSGIDTGDEIWLLDNPLSQQSIDVDIPALEARGVIVHQTY